MGKMGKPKKKGKQPKARRNHKDTVFTSLFGDKKRLLELYNAIKGTSYSDPEMISINTLSSALFMGKHNDISFTIGGKLVVLIEHQSTINKNMPLRSLIYISEVYKKILPHDSIFSEALTKIPRPEFIVLYNGEDEYPDETILRLSDAFETAGEQNNVLLELEVKVLNINKGRNAWMGERSESLSGYSELIAKIREFGRNGLGKDEAVRRAVYRCMDEKILLNYLKDHASEVINMLCNELKIDTAKRIWQREARDEGIAIGRAGYIEEERSYIQSLQSQGFTAEEILSRLTAAN